MKFKLLLIVLITLGTLNCNAQQVANGSFENWTSGPPVASTPVSWDSYDRLFYEIGVQISYTIPQRGWCTQDTAPANVYYGHSSCKLKTDTVSIPAFGSSPQLIIGTVAWGSLVFTGTSVAYSGVPYAYRPLTFSGALKFAPSGSDTAGYNLQLTKWDATGDSEILVGIDERYILSTGGVWATFSDTILYFTNDTPDSIKIAFESSYASTPKIGTLLWVDSLVLQGSAQSQNLTVQITGQEPSCNGLTNGSVIANVSGGSTPYFYSWAGHSSVSSDTLSPLGAGTYSVTVTDANHNTASGSYTLGQPTAVSVNCSTTPSTSTGSNGSATANPSGGTSPYTFLWSNGQATATASGLAPGTDTVTITDNHGCTAVGLATIVVSGINNLNGIISGIAIYPNPVNDQLTLSLELAQKRTVDIRIFDLTGKVLYFTNDSGSGKLNRQIDVSKFNSGIYLLEVTAGEGYARNKFIVTH